MALRGTTYPIETEGIELKEGHYETRDEIARLANEEARKSRRGGAPHLTATSSRVDVLRWLQWNDPNGAYLDELAKKEDVDPLTLEEAWETLEKMLRDEGLGRHEGLGNVRAQDRGTWFSVTIGEREIEDFMDQWPASGLDGLRHLYAEFDKRNGDIVDLRANHGRTDTERFDGSALRALTEDMQCTGAKKLKLDLELHCRRGEGLEGSKGRFYYLMFRGQAPEGVVYGARFDSFKDAKAAAARHPEGAVVAIVVNTGRMDAPLYYTNADGSPGAKVEEGFGRSKSMTAGVLPSFEEFDKAFDEVIGEDKKYRIRLGRSDSRAADGTSIGDDDYTSSELYQGLEELVDKGTDDALDLASGILTTLGFEWI